MSVTSTEEWQARHWQAIRVACSDAGCRERLAQRLWPLDPHIEIIVGGDRVTLRMDRSTAERLAAQIVKDPA